MKAASTFHTTLTWLYRLYSVVSFVRSYRSFAYDEFPPSRGCSEPLWWRIAPHWWLSECRRGPERISNDLAKSFLRENGKWLFSWKILFSVTWAYPTEPARLRPDIGLIGFWDEVVWIHRERKYREKTGKAPRVQRIANEALHLLRPSYAVRHPDWSKVRTKRLVKVCTTTFFSKKNLSSASPETTAAAAQQPSVGMKFSQYSFLIQSSTWWWYISSETTELLMRPINFCSGAFFIVGGNLNPHFWKLFNY